MPNLKRIMISLPENLLAEVDGILINEKRSRSDLVREAMRLYLTEKKRRAFRDDMRRGYLEMAQLNLALALENYEEEMGAAGLREVAECT